MGRCKSSEPNVVKMADLHYRSVSEVFSTFIDHIRAYGNERRGVVSVSRDIVSSLQDLRPAFWRRMRRQLSRAAIICVFTAGKHAEDLDVQGEPRVGVDSALASIASYRDPGIKRVLVASNSDSGGNATHHHNISRLVCW